MHLRYGTNPHQQPARASPLAPAHPPLRVVNGTLSYINVLDALGAWQLVGEASADLGTVAATSFKHTSPAGAAVAGPIDPVMAETFDVSPTSVGALTSAYVRARDADPKSSYGDVVAVSEPVDGELADLLRRLVCDRPRLRARHRGDALGQLVRAVDRVESGLEVFGYGVGGGDGVLAGLDLDRAVAAGGGDEPLDGPVGGVASQGQTIPEALRNLTEAVELYLGEVDDSQLSVASTPPRHFVPGIRRGVSPALSDLPLRKVIHIIEPLGFAYVRTKGSHAVYRNADGRVVIIPQHRTVKRGTLASILRQAWIKLGDFRELLG